MDDHPLAAELLDREEPLEYVLGDRLALEGGVVNNVAKELPVSEVDAGNGRRADASRQPLLPFPGDVDAHHEVCVGQRLRENEGYVSRFAEDA